MLTAVHSSAIRTNESGRQDEKDFLRPYWFGPLHIYLARHFGFCYGVENASILPHSRRKSGRNIYLLSEMIHSEGKPGPGGLWGIRFLSTWGSN
jgi:4-hydroxy-3-methylbut-2-enyl diphosphate reductase